MEINTSLIHLAGIRSLSNLNEALSILTKEIEVLKDERNEYRRKWLEATKCEVSNEEPGVKQIPN